MKRGIIIFTYVLLAGGLVYFAVTANMAEKRAERLNKALMDAETRLIEIESEMLFSEPPSSPAPAETPAESGTQPAAPADTYAPSAATQSPASAEPIRFVSLTAAGTTNLIRIEGTSSIHDWQVEGNIIGGMAEMEPMASLLSGGTSGRAIRAKVNSFVPVRSLRSVEKDGSHYSSAMDEIMFGKLNAQSHGRILYSLTSLTARERATGNPGGIVCDAKGQLAIAGRTNDVAMQVTITPRGDKALQLTGSCALKMTDFGIEPPSPSLGGVSIKTGDDVTLKFVWNVENR